MIIGIGIDIIEIKRICRACDNPRFMQKIFTASELEYFKSRKNNPQTTAGSFAAKEAVSKALGTGFGEFGWKEIEILRKNEGSPYVNLYSRAAEHLEKIGGKRIHISISHSREYAVAQALIESEET